MSIQRLIITILFSYIISQMLIFVSDFEKLLPFEYFRDKRSKLELCLQGEPTDEIRVVGLGDSLTAGVGDDRNIDGYFGRLNHYLQEKNCTVMSENFSTRGFTTNHLLKQLKDEKLRNELERADVILFTIGANDLISVLKEVHLSLQFDLTEKAQTQYGNNFEKVLDEIRGINHHGEIYYIGFYNPIKDKYGSKYINSLVAKWNGISEEKVKQYNDAYFVAIDDIFAHEPKRFLSTDKFHPNDLGYEVIMQRILTHMID